MTTPEQDDSAQEEPLTGPGEHLRRGREEQGISVAEIANELKLSESLIQALEADDASSLPAAAFVRGYLRSYARLLGLDAARLVEAYERISGATADAGIRISERSQDGFRMSSRLALLLLVLLIGGAAAWWFWEDAPFVVGEEGDVPVSSDTAEPAEEAAVEPVVPETLEAGDVADSGPAEVSPPEPLFPQVQMDPDLFAELDAEVEAVFEETPAELGEGGELLADDPGDVEATGIADPGNTSASAEEAVTAAGTSGPDELLLRVDGESWIEIYDDADRRLVYTLYAGDEPVDVRGWAPFEVFLGNARVVRLEYDGAEVDLSEFLRANDTARIVVDADGARVP